MVRVATINVPENKWTEGKAYQIHHGRSLSGYGLTAQRKQEGSRRDVRAQGNVGGWSLLRSWGNP